MHETGGPFYSPTDGLLGVDCLPEEGVTWGGSLQPRCPQRGLRTERVCRGHQGLQGRLGSLLWRKQALPLLRAAPRTGCGGDVLRIPVGLSP